jgi:predicted secreted acid phosphatase
MDTVYQEWFKYLNLVYAKILQDSIYFNRTQPIMIDIDNTVLHNSYYEIPGAVNFVNKLAKHFSIYFVTARTNTINNRNATMKSLHNFTYDKLLMRPPEIKTAIYKYNIKKNINAEISIGDKLTDYPEYLLYCPFNIYPENI